MTAGDTVEINSIETVLRELVPLLEEVQQTLESGLDEDRGAAAAGELTARLREIRGTLELLDLAGPCALVEEMLALASGLSDGRVERVEAALEVLLKAVLKLPDYLDRLRSGRRDVPAVLLPLINELRTARGASALDERAVFFPRLERKPAAPASAEDSAALQQTAKRLRPRFQRALLAWYRGGDAETYLSEIGVVLQEIASATGSPAAVRLWSVCGALTESLADQGLEADTEVKRLMGRVERLLSQLVRAGEAALERQIPVDLLRSLLYYVARSGSDSERVREVKRAYQLEELLPGSDVPADFEGPNSALLGVVGDGIRDELAQVKDAIELYVHSDQRSTDALEGLPRRLGEVADTFSMLGLQDAHDTLQAEAEVLARIGDYGPGEADQRLQELAAVLLRVEDDLAQLRRGRPGGDAGAEPDMLAIRGLPESEYRALVSAIISASLDDLSKVREAIGAYCGDPSAGREAMAEVPDLLDEVRGPIVMLPLTSALPVVDAFREYVRTGLLGRGSAPSNDEQMLVADVVAGLEYYLEAVEHDRAGMTHLLESAERAMEALRSGGEGHAHYEDEQVVMGPEDTADEPNPGVGGAQAGIGTEAAAPAGGEEPGAPADDRGGQAPQAASDPSSLDADTLALGDLDPTGFDEAARAEGGSGGGDVAPPQAGPATAGDDAGADDAAAEATTADPGDQTAVRTGAGAAEPGRPTAPEGAAGGRAPAAGVDPAATGSSQLAVLADDADDEIVEVFVQEAVGELDRINEHLTKWRGNRGDEESLIVVRRAFHKLKGGARLIGAELIGEFSWSIENMMNRVIDHSIDASEAVRDTLDEAAAALPQLIEQLQGNRSPIEGIDDLIARAHALSRGEQGPPPSAGAGTGGGPPAGGDGGPAGGAGPAEAPGGRDERTADAGDAGASGGESGNEAAGCDSSGDEAPDAEGTEVSAADATGTSDGDGDAGGAAAGREAPTEEEAPDAEGTEVSAADATGTSDGDGDAGGAAAGCEAPSEDESEVAEGAEVSAPGAADTTHGGDAGTATAGHDALGEDEAAVERPRSDDTLTDIFLEEAAGHQAVLRRELGGSDCAPQELVITTELVHALHTLVGSAETVEAEPVVDLSTRMEKIVKDWRDRGVELDADTVQLLRECIDRLDRALEAVATDGTVETADLVERLDRVLGAAEEEHGRQGEGEGELLDIFIDEGDEILEECDRAVTRWRQDPDDAELIPDLQRNLHTLKGGARMANFPPIADLTHEVESLVDAVADGTCSLGEDVLDLLQEAVDALTVLLEQARGRNPVSRVDWLVEDLRNLRERGGGHGGRSDAGTGEQPPAAAAGEDTGTPSEAQAEAPTAGAPDAGSTGQGSGKPAPDKRDTGDAPAYTPGSEQIRVQAELLDNLVNYAGEVSIYHSRIGEQLGQYRFNIRELEQTVNRLRTQLRDMENETESQILHRHEKERGDAEPRHAKEEFDPLELDRYTRLQELSRALSESVGDLDSLKEIMENVTRDAEQLLLQQSRVSSELQDGLMQTRMVRFDGLRARLGRVVRQTANTVGTKAQMEMSGGELEVDRSIQERVVAPLEHILRNAVSHGIERPERRRALGKPEAGTVSLDLHRGGTDILIELSDDGGGIDPDKVRRKAIEKGMIDPDDDRDDNEVIKLILETGFSTADEVTQISGRGVGMDVVDAEIRRLGGTLGIQTELGAGSRFTVRLPVTLAINQAVMIQAGPDNYAIPITSIEGVAQVAAGELKQYYLEPDKPYRYAGNDYRVQHLGTVLGTSEPRLDDESASCPVIMVRAGDDRVALHVDGLIGRREVVVKPLGAPLNTLPGISGATIMADGEVVLILDMGGLLRTETRFIARRGERAALEQEAVVEQGESEATSASKAPTVLVVDDSITIRKVTNRILERNGMNVATAKDGVDAVSWMGQSVPDLILLDIEMPRMDGYEVASYIRGDSRLKDVPIIMITSRTGAKHKERAEDLGVDRYLGKPYQEHELLENIQAVMGEHAGEPT